MTKEEFAEVTLPLAAGFPFPMAPAWLKLLMEAVKHFDAEHVRVAVLRAVMTHEHQSHPPIATIIRYADEAANGVEMTADQAIGLVWAAVKKHQGHDADCHRAAYADLGPKVVAVMKAAGGYQRFCDCKSADKGTLTAQFREAWNATIRRQEQHRRLPAALVPRVNGPLAAIGHSTSVALIEQGGDDR